MLKKEAIEGIKNGTVLFENLSYELRADKEVVMAAVGLYGFALEFASDELKADKKVVLAAVGSYGYGSALQFASNELKGDKEVVLVAVRQYGLALKYASDELRGDKEIVLAAIDNFGVAYLWCSELMQRDPDVISLVNQKLKGYGESVDNYLCDELKELKKKYSTDTLRMALEMEAADMESAKLLSSGHVVRNNLSSVVKRV